MFFPQVKSNLTAGTVLAGLIMLCNFGCSNVKEVETPEEYTLSSPDKKVSVLLSWDTNLSPQFSVTLNNQLVVLPSPLDLIPRHAKPVEHDLVWRSEQTIDEVWPLPWGQFNQAHNNYKNAEFHLVNKETHQVISTLEFRVFNDAVAFRHKFDESTSPSNSTFDEVSHFNFASDAAAWGYRAQHNPKQVVSLLSSHSETLQPPIALAGLALPSMAIQEAGRLETSIIQLTTLKEGSGLAVVSDPIQLHHSPSSTSWRVLQLADKAGELITAQTLMNLSPPSRLSDTSWIQTGKSFWDWRVRGARYGAHTYALDNESLRRMIDFAAENGMQHVMIDANWYGPEHNVSSNPFTEIEGLNIRQLIAEADEKGVGFILYLNDKASVNYDLDKLFETWSNWGAAGVKYGFMKLNGADKVRKTVRIVELAAKHKLLINFHDDPIPPSGLRRTWPNWVTREAVHGQTDGKRSYTPSGFIEMAHVNALAGPLDMSNGFFQLDGLKQSRKYVRSEVYSTLASELARTLVIFSGLIILPDAPEEYLQKQELFAFLKAMPTTWDESRVLSSDIQHHIVTARRSDEEWFIGAVINEEGGTLPLKLDFLKPNQLYKARIFSDTAETHYKTNREAYQIQTIQVQKGDSIPMTLAPGGGQALWLKPLERGDK